MSIESLSLKVLRVKTNDNVFVSIKNHTLIVTKDISACPNAKKITLEEANEILNLLDIDNTLAYIHFNQLWEKYREIKNLR